MGKVRIFIQPDFAGVVAALTEDDATFRNTTAWLLERPFAYPQVGMAFFQAGEKFPQYATKIDAAHRRWLKMVEVVWPGNRIPKHIYAAQQAIRRSLQEEPAPLDRAISHSTIRAIAA